MRYSGISMPTRVESELCIRVGEKGNLMVPPGIEPGLTASEAIVLSIGPRNQWGIGVTVCSALCKAGSIFEHLGIEFLIQLHVDEKWVGLSLQQPVVKTKQLRLLGGGEDQ